MSKTQFTTSTGNEVMIGLNVYNVWTVSCWDADLNCIWDKQFDDESSAREYFDRIEVEG